MRPVNVIGVALTLFSATTVRTGLATDWAVSASGRQAAIIAGRINSNTGCRQLNPRRPPFPQWKPTCQERANDEMRRRSMNIELL